MIQIIVNKNIITCIMFIIVFFFTSSHSIHADEAQELQTQAAMFFQPIPEQPPELKNNPMTLDKVRLGKMLYFDPRISSSHLISCNTCHNIGLGGADLQEQSVGHRWQKGRRNAPTVFNSVFNSTQFWDGRAPDLAKQAQEPIEGSVEMNNSFENLVDMLKRIPAYVKLFETVFTTSDNSINLINITKAIEVFEATLITPNGRFDKYLNGDMDALSQDEQDGLALFMERNCASCHYGVNLGGKDFYVFGRLLDPQRSDVRPVDDLGRYEITGIEHDKYVYRAASLRNVELTAPYFHSGKVWSLVEAVQTMGYSQLGYSPSDKDARKIAAFFKTLTGDQPKIEYPLLPANEEKSTQPVL